MWVEAGLDPDAFWTKTPREVLMILEARRAFETKQHNDRMALAWHIAAFTRMKVMPKLSRLMVKAQAKRHQTWQEQMAIMDAYAQRLKQSKSKVH